MTTTLLTKSLLPSIFKSTQPWWSAAPALITLPHKLISTSTTSSYAWAPDKGPKRWKEYNYDMFPPQTPEEKTRPAYVCHHMENVKYSELKLWYVACFVRGMAIDEALRQLDYIKRKGAAIVKATLLEAQELAVREHNVEFRSNLWVAESMSTKGIVIKGLRRHARKRFGIIHYRHSHYFVRLEEGKPPEHYYPPESDGPTLLQNWIQERREQIIHRTL